MSVDSGGLPGSGWGIIQQQAELVGGGQVKLAFLISDLGSRARAVKSLPDWVEVNGHRGQILGSQITEGGFRIGEDQGSIWMGGVPAVHKIE